MVFCVPRRAMGHSIVTRVSIVGTCAVPLPSNHSNVTVEAILVFFFVSEAVCHFMVTMISILVFFGCKRAMCHFMVTMVSFWSFLVGNVPFHRHRVFWSFWSKVELVLVFFGGQCAISSSPGILVFLEQGGIDFGLFWWTVGHFIVTEYFGLFGAR